MPKENLRFEYATSKATQSRFESVCPYCGEVIYQGDMIAKGSKGWGCVACVNLKAHYRGGKRSDTLCLTSISGYGKIVMAWDKVTCKKCLKIRGTERGKQVEQELKERDEEYERHIKERDENFQNKVEIDA
jgi:hypothetical protein